MTGSEFAEVRERLGWSRRWLARVLGYDQTTVRQMELGQQRVPEAVGAWLKRKDRDWQRDPPPPR